MKNLPEKFSERMKSFPQFDYEAYIESLNQPAVKGFRVNTDKISFSEFEKINIFGNNRIPFTENGFYLDYDKAGNHPFHHAGMIYIQEPAAMAPAECIDINPGWTILDMCAAPGGKSTQLRNKLGNRGVLVSNEIISSRCKILTGNIERMGSHNTITTCMDTNKLSSLFPAYFDLIMCDAPCSGEGMFRKDPVAIDEWSEENVRKCAKRQLEILENAVKMLKNGGYIIYATCTFSLEENEMVIDSFLTAHPEFGLCEVKDIVKQHTVSGIKFDGCKSGDINLTRRFYPYISKGEGQFMAILKNNNEPLPCKLKPTDKKGIVDKVIFDFLDDVLSEYNRSNVRIHNNNAVYISSDTNINISSAFSFGITIGEIKKNYIQPHHQFFMALGNYFRRKIELHEDSDELKRYLHGEEINVNCSNGWAVITVRGCTLGGVKVVNGKAKNHYPKGLRLRNM